jgi:hypothetical protein
MAAHSNAEQILFLCIDRFRYKMPAIQKIFRATIFLFAFVTSVCANAQEIPTQSATRNDTIYATTQPVGGQRPFVYELQAELSQADTIGRRYRVRIDNIGFIVSKTGTIDSTWIIFRPRPIHNEVMKILKASRWIPARQDGLPIVSAQQTDIDVYLTKKALKRHRSWRSLGERIISPWL